MSLTILPEPALLKPSQMSASVRNALIPAAGGGGSLPLLRSDPVTASDPTNLWGQIEAESPSSHTYFATGGPTGGPFRRMTCAGGSWQGGSNERAELGRNERRYGLSSPGDNDGTFFLYFDGDRRVTSFDFRIDPTWPISTPHWATIMQMKQAQPNEEEISSPIIAIEAREGALEFRGPLDESSNAPYFSASYTPGNWVHIILDMVYSQDDGIGSATVTFGAPVSSAMPLVTLATQSVDDAPHSIYTGDPIPSHIRLGMYYDSVLGNPYHGDYANIEVRG